VVQYWNRLCSACLWECFMKEATHDASVTLFWPMMQYLNRLSYTFFQSCV
jgi:hypothetical protein